MRIEIIICIVVFVLFMIIKSIIDIKNDRKKTVWKLLSNWGAEPESLYDPGKLESLTLYYEEHADMSDIDDITWNDLDMDELFILLNHTESAMGEEVLYNLLRKPICDKNELKHRSSIINHMFDNEEDRLNIQEKLVKIGKDKKLSFYQVFKQIENIKEEKNIFHYISIVMIIACITGIILNFQPCIYIGIVLLITLIITYYKRKAEIEVYYYVFGRILKLLYHSQYISNCNISVLKNETDDIKKYIKVFSKFKRNSSIVLKDNGGNISDILFDYLRMITHIDLIKFNNMYKIVKNNKHELLMIHEKIGYIDAMIAIASFRKMVSDKCYCEPDFCYKNKELRFTDGFHPYLKNPVYNDFDTTNNVLLTGSNASGKSTFLKTIALNAILAQTIVTVCARNYKTSFFKVMTSMALSDNIFNSKSYFVVEILSLKRILDCPESNILVCIDEVLRGTNTIERIAASGQILKSLSEKNILCFAATHDIELTEILEKIYNNYHFRERIEDDNVIFDYKIYEGASKTKNAIKLLNMLGYDKNIVNNAENMAKLFEDKKIWLKI